MTTQQLVAPIPVRLKIGESVRVGPTGYNLYGENRA
jgi:hypothetical protein